VFARVSRWSEDVDPPYVFTGKRIGYGLSNTILYVGKSEAHAERSVKWLKNNIQYNTLFTETFALRRGEKWTDTQIEIWHGTDEYPITIFGVGITGSIRGINFEDYRPDLIIVDDVIDEENAATPEQREKMSNLLLGAVMNSLAPRSEAPHAKMVILQTPLNKEDAAMQAFEDPAFSCERFGCWTDDTADLPLLERQSRWDERYPAEELRKKKEEYIARNRLSVFIREYECKIVSPETSAFMPSWLEYYDLAPEEMSTVLVIDPVPPPSPTQIAKGMAKKDFEALAVVGAHKGKVFLLEYVANKGHEPDWTIAEFFRLGLKWRPRLVVVEAVAYQRTLAWLLRKAMEQRRQYFVIDEYTDQRSKYDRILDGLTDIASNGKLFVRREQIEFIQQFCEYPAVSHDDILEAVAIGCSKVQGPGGYVSYAQILEEEKNIPALTYEGGCP
jgi:hypothetical protein